MLTLPDFKEKKVVFIIPKDGIDKSIRLENSNICLLENENVTTKLTIYSVLALMIIGDCTITTNLINKLTDMGISIYFLGYDLKNKNHINASADGNYALREKQYYLNEISSTVISKLIVKNKIVNQIATLKKANREDLSKIKNHIFEEIDKTNTLQELLAREGNFASKYFPLMFADVDWHRRAPQTKEDPINLILDIGYTILFNYIDSLLSLFGFDLYKGIYHREFYKRKSLVCDLMEAIRPLIDYATIKAVNLGQINFDNDFLFNDSQFTLKDYQTRKKYLNIYTTALLTEKEQVYDYVLSFYRFMMNSEKYNFKEFLI